MEVRITFRAELYVEGDTLDEVKNNFENMPLFSIETLADGGAQFVEYISIEDAETHKDLMPEWR